MSVAYWICAIFTLASAFTSFGFSVVAFVSSDKGPSQTNAMYASSRSVALVIASLVPFSYHSVPWLAAVSLVMIIIQFTDAIIGFKIKDNLKTYGPALTAVFNLIALIIVVK